MESSRPGGDTDASQKTVTLKRDIDYSLGPTESDRTMKLPNADLALVKR